MPDIRVIANLGIVLGESPVWDVRAERLYWSSLLDGLIFRSTPDGGEVSVRQFRGSVNSFALCESARAILTSGTAVYLYDFDSDESELLFDAGGGPQINGNDGKVDRDGRFVFGLSERRLAGEQGPDPSSAETPRGSVWRIGAERNAEQLLADIGITNGPCFSPDGRLFYVSDSWRRQIYALAYPSDGPLAGRRRVVTTFAETGPQGEPTRPDGATVDEEGCLWVAAVYAGEVRRYTPEGELDRAIVMPVPKPTSVAFGGQDMDVLFVTSMAHRGSEFDSGASAAPLGGSLFAIHGLGVRGIPETRFAAG